MAHLIEVECVACGLCTAVCPETCILEDDQAFVIDVERCTDCGDCVPACPINCILGTKKG